MNVDSLRSSRSSYGDPRYLSSGYPNGAVSLVPSRALDGYRSMSDVGTDDRSQYSGSGAIPPKNVPSIDVTDPVLLHLLTETAIGDSAGYEILPFEEIEDLKREHEVLSNRIESTKRKLALETKLRDAAKSLSRLPNPKANGNGEYTNGNTNGVAHHPEDEELAVSSQKCEQLSQELWAVERRAQDVHKRLLEHTAGILQLTHRGLKKNAKRDSTNHVPNGAGFDFDERSFYKALEVEDTHGLKADVDTLRRTEQKLEDLNGRLRDILFQGHADRDASPLPLRVNNDTSLAYIQDHLAYLETSLETLQIDGLPGSGPVPEISATEMEIELSAINSQLQSLLGQAGSHLSPTLPPPPSPSGQYLNGHIDYLRSGMEDLQGRVERLQDQKSILTTQIQQQRELNSKSDAERDAHVADLAQQLMETRKELELSEREAQTVRNELGLVMEQLDTAKQQQNIQDQQLEIDKDKAEKEVEHLREQLDLVMEQLNAAKEQQNTQYQQLETGKIEAEREAERLREELGLMTEQLDAAHQHQGTQYQQLANDKVEAEKAAERLQGELGLVIEQLNAAKEQQNNQFQQLETEKAKAEKEAEHLREELGLVMEQLNAAKEQQNNQFQQLEAEKAKAEKEAEHLREELGLVMEQLDVTKQQQDIHHQQLANDKAEVEKEAERLREELEHVEGEYARAQTELTVVKAELDGAYGTRAERAAEAAANPALYKEIEDLHTRNISLAEELAALRAEQTNRDNGQGDLQKRVETLQKELEETIEDYESMTKASIEFEKERERYESTIDSFRDRCEQLETQLSDERITWMGVNSQTAARDGAMETTSTMVLKNEFKKMMRDTRAENMKLLRAEQEERKKLEVLVRSLKMEQTMGKSNLSQNMVA
ncbi:hypothetical protein UA08_04704 [Talaromyces atroroseus]|uniref:Uncharacterized protein n=1 Tax=Talaromyces atroroseus TaxID=1441469 RepID=A0A225AEX9_TALAT|nr:hypothetical protein UA08_04704 [Talaromyces atroroseus]OKL59852.1 hypothetical protein UA08_04704 [Talaromyces atroroseus]